MNECDGIFMERATALLGALAPALVWVRDNKGVPIDIDPPADDTDKD